MTQTVAGLVGGLVRLFVSLTNVSDHPIEVDKEYDADGVDRNYAFELAIDGGTELETESAGKGKVPASRTITLNPGKFTIDPICLNCLYGGFSAPGKYTLYLTHKVRSNGETSTVRSNRIRFLVVQKEETEAPPFEIKLTLSLTRSSLQALQFCTRWC